MYKQGELDSLCGVYAVINSTVGVCKREGRQFRREEWQALFKNLCRLLGKEGRLPDALVNGTEVRTVQRMLRAAHAWVRRKSSLNLTSTGAFRSEPQGLDAYWSRVLEHVQEFGSGSVIVGMSGSLDHWTCIRSMTDLGISLMDSDSVKALRRSRCTVGDGTRRRPHVLWPTQTLLVSVSR